MRLPVLFLGIVLAATLGVAAGEQAKVEIEQAAVGWDQVARADGQKLYSELCAACHGLDATGRGPAAPALKTPVPDLTRLALRNDGSFPGERVQRVIAGDVAFTAHGAREMPVWGDVLRNVRPDYKMIQRESFARTRILELAAYLEDVQVR